MCCMFFTCNMVMSLSIFLILRAFVCFLGFCVHRCILFELFAVGVLCIYSTLQTPVGRRELNFG